MFKVDLIRQALRESFVFINTVSRERQRPLAEICKSLLYYAFQKLLTLHAHTGSSCEPFVYFNSDTITHLLLKLFCACRNSIFSSP